jgi:hypothetical protein
MKIKNDNITKMNNINKKTTKESISSKEKILQRVVRIFNKKKNNMKQKSKIEIK